MKIILGVRKLLGSTFRIGVVWLMAGALFLAWVMWQDLFHLEYPFGYYYFFAGPSLMVLHMVLVRILRVPAQRIARKRLRAAKPHYLKASAYIEGSNLDQAVAEYNTIIGIDPDNPRAYMGRGMVNDLKGMYDLAIADYTAAIEIEPFLRGLAHRPSIGSDAGKYDLAWAYHYRGLSYLSKGKSDQANRDFESAIAVRSVFFPQTIGDVGPLEDFANNSFPTFGRVRSDAADTVHYVKPCGVVRKNKGGISFYSRHYVGVSCRTCLDSRPNRNRLTESIGTPIERASLACIPLVAPKYGWPIFEHLVDGQIFPWLMVLLMHVIGFSVLWADILEELLMKMVRPLATAFLARPFYDFR